MDSTPLVDSTILIIGANGQVGRALQDKYSAAQKADSAELDITDQLAVSNYDWTGITTVINAAAYTNVDGAETNAGRQSAWHINAVGVRNLCDIALAKGLTLVHISSDYVFDGTIDNHLETEPYTPLGVYGQSKAAGDIAVSLVPQHYILRTTWVIGEGKNFVRTMISLGQKGISPTVVADQIGRLTFTSEVVRAIDHLLTTKASFGTYNVSNDGTPASWADITRTIFQDAGFELSVTDTTTEQYFIGKENIADRPLASSLNLEKLHQTGFQSHDWHDDLKAYITKELTV